MPSRRCAAIPGSSRRSAPPGSETDYRCAALRSSREPVPYRATPLGIAAIPVPETDVPPIKVMVLDRRAREHRTATAHDPMFLGLHRRCFVPGIASGPRHTFRRAELGTAGEAVRRNPSPWCGFPTPSQTTMPLTAEREAGSRFLSIFIARYPILSA